MHKHALLSPADAAPAHGRRGAVENAVNAALVQEEVRWEPAGRGLAEFCVSVDGRFAAHVVVSSKIETNKIEIRILG